MSLHFILHVSLARVVWSFFGSAVVLEERSGQICDHLLVEEFMKFKATLRSLGALRTAVLGSCKSCELFGSDGSITDPTMLQGTVEILIILAY